MTPPIGLQLYSIRFDLPNDFAGVVNRIAEAGYVGVEPAFGTLGTTPQEAAQLFQALGLEVPSAHTPLPLGDDRNKVLDHLAAFGCQRMISGKGPDAFKTPDLIKRTCDLFTVRSPHRCPWTHPMAS